MNRKLVGSIAVIIVIVLLITSILWYYSYISLVTGVLISIIPILSPFIAYLVKYFQKSKVDLQIKNAEFIAKGFDHTSTGYQLKAFVTNKGRKICLNLNDVSIVIKDSKGQSPPLLKARALRKRK